LSTSFFYGPVGNRTLSQHQSSATRYKRVVSPTVESVLHHLFYITFASVSSTFFSVCAILFSSPAQRPDAASWFHHRSTEQSSS